MNCVIEQPPALVSAAKAVPSESELAQLFAVSGNVKGLRDGIACIDEGIFKSESLGKHAAVLRMGVMVLGGDACLGDVMMMAEEGTSHVAIPKATVSAYRGIDSSKDVFCIVESG